MRSSDLPKLATIHLAEPLNIISLHINSPDKSTLHTPLETEQQTIDRYSRMAISLMKCIQLHKVDVLTLQCADVALLKHVFELQLSEEWRIFTAIKAGLMTCCHKNRFVFDQHVRQYSDISQTRIQTIHIKDKKNKQHLVINNVWSIPSKFADQVQKYYTDILKLAEYTVGKTCVVLIGDFQNNLSVYPHKNFQELDFSSGCLISGHDETGKIQKIDAKPFALTDGKEIKTELALQAAGDLSRNPLIYSKFEQYQCLVALKKYTKQRQSEWGICAFFRNLAKYNCKFKTDVANKLHHALSDKLCNSKFSSGLTFTADELDALLQENSNLKKIIVKYILEMPERIQEAFQARSKSVPPLSKKS